MRPVQASVPAAAAAAVGCSLVPGREAPAGTAAPSVSLIKSQSDNGPSPADAAPVLPR